MTDPALRKARELAHFDKDYETAPNVEAQFRYANALDYMAFQLGRIRRTLDEINERQKAQTGR